MITPLRKRIIGQEAGICERCNNEEATHQTVDVYSPLSITLLYTLFNAHWICFRGVFNALYNWSWGRGDGNRWGGLKVPPWYEGTHVRVVREHFISDEFAKQEGQLCKTWMCLVVLVTTIWKTMEQSHYNQLGTIKTAYKKAGFYSILEMGGLRIFRHMEEKRGKRKTGREKKGRKLGDQKEKRKKEVKRRDKKEKKRGNP